MLTVFDMVSNLYSPNGHLLQVDYAEEVVHQGSTIVGLCTKDCVILGAEKGVADALQVQRTTQKIKKIDEQIAMAFAGLSADARVLYSRAQLEAQNYRLHYSNAASVEYMARYLADVKQTYTRGSNRRPFGVSCLIGGFDYNGKPHLFRTDPSGVYCEWLINIVGRMGQTINKYLQKNVNAMSTFSDTISAMKYVARTLQIASSSDASFDMTVLKYKQPIEFVSTDKKKYLTDLIKQETMGYTTRRHFGLN